MYKPFSPSWHSVTTTFFFIENGGPKPYYIEKNIVFKSLFYLFKLNCYLESQDKLDGFYTGPECTLLDNYYLISN